jgi:hypothetical protein
LARIICPVSSVGPTTRPAGKLTGRTSAAALAVGSSDEACFPKVDVPKRTDDLLKVAALWGTEVVAHRELRPGESLGVGDGPGSLVAKPDGVAAPDYPVYAVRGGWEVDPAGSTGGLLYLGGNPSDPSAQQGDAARQLVDPGDCGLLRYGEFALFFQRVRPAPPVTRRSGWDPAWLGSLLLSLVVVVGGLALVRALTRPGARPKPLELTSRGELGARFRVSPELFEARPQASSEPRRVPDPALGELLDPGDTLRAALGTDGPNRSPPAPVPSGTGGLAPSASGSSDGLSPAEVSRVVMARYQDFRACYALFMGALPGREGSVTVSFTITQRGRPDGATIGSSTLHDQRIEDCILRRFATLRFPASDHPTHASFTFSFKGNKS